MTQPWFSWVVKDYQKEILDVIEELGLRMEDANDPTAPGEVLIFVDPPSGYTNADIMTAEEYEARDTLHPDSKLHERSLEQIHSSCDAEAQFGTHIWFEARRGCPSDYFGKPRPVCVGRVHSVHDYCHMLLLAEGIVIEEYKIKEKINEYFPMCSPDDKLCSFMGWVGMKFPDWLKQT